MVMQEVTTLLREKGFKVTPQRLAVYDVLCHTKAHPTADMIYGELQPTYPTMSLATVYKTLDILSKVGLVQVLNVGEESFRYDANTRSMAPAPSSWCRWRTRRAMPFRASSCISTAGVPPAARQRIEHRAAKKKTAVTLSGWLRFFCTRGRFMRQF